MPERGRRAFGPRRAAEATGHVTAVGLFGKPKPVDLVAISGEKLKNEQRRGSFAPYCHVPVQAGSDVALPILRRYAEQGTGTKKWHARRDLGRSARSPAE